MKKTLFCLVLMAVSALSVSAQMMKPSVMVIPSNAWCQEHGFMMQSSSGNSYPDYRRAVAGSTDLINVISKINIIMGDRGFPLENLESALKALSETDVERKLYTDAEGNSIRISAIDELYTSAATDIVLQLTWKVNEMGPKKSVTFNLQAIDSYTNKQVAGAEGTGKPSFSADLSTLLEEAVLAHMDVFCDRLVRHFQETRDNGREVSIDVLLSDAAEVDFNTEFDDDNLQEAITAYIAKESVNHRFSRGAATESMLQYKSVRIPVHDENGTPIDAYAFARRLAKYLKKEPFVLTTKVIAKGLGQATVIIGDE